MVIICFLKKKKNEMKQRIDNGGIKCTRKCEQNSSEHPEEAPGLTPRSCVQLSQHTNPGAVWLLL